MKLTIKTLKQVNYPVELAEGSSIMQLKEEISNKHNFDSNTIKLLFNGVVLEDSKLLTDYGLKDGYVLMMMSAKAKPQNVVKEEKKSEEPVPVGTLSQTGTEDKSKKKSNVAGKETGKSSVEKPVIKKDYTSEIGQLKEMGFSEELSKQAIEAADGNVSLAIEFLYNGIPSNIPGQTGQLPQLSEFLDEEGEMEEVVLSPEILGNLDLNNPNTLNTIASICKVLIQDDPSSLADILSDIEESNPEIISFIKDNETQFKSLIEQPITQQDIQLFDSLTGNHVHDEEGEEGEELDEEAFQELINSAAQLAGGNTGVQITGLNPNVNQSGTGNNISNTQQSLNLNQTDKDSIERLKGLGFSESEAIQAYIACDKNETLAANFLFDNKFKEDNMDIDCKI